MSLPLLSVLACEPTGGSMFIAAYVAGLAMQVGFRDVGTQSLNFTEGWGQLFDFFIFFYFGLVVIATLPSFVTVHLLYAVLSPTLVRMLPVALTLAGTGLSAATVLFLGWFIPRSLASIVLSVVFLEEATELTAEGTIRLVVIAAVLLSIFARGVAALPGFGVYARKVAGLAEAAPEKEAA